MTSEPFFRLGSYRSLGEVLGPGEGQVWPAGGRRGAVLDHVGGILERVICKRPKKVARGEKWSILTKVERAQGGGLCRPKETSILGPGRGLSPEGRVGASRGSGVASRRREGGGSTRTAHSTSAASTGERRPRETTSDSTTQRARRAGARDLKSGKTSFF